MFLSRDHILLLLACLLGIGFIVFTFFVLKGSFLSIDNYIDQALHLTKSSFLYFISVILAYLFIPLVAVIALVFFQFILSNQKYEAMMVLTGFSGFVIAELVLKPILKIQCPPTYYSDVLSGQGVYGLSRTLQKIALGETCYPSGHVAAYVVLCGYLVYLVLRYVKETRKRFVLLAALIGIVALIGPSRVYLHVHWLSDVVGAYLLGFALLLFVISLRNKKLGI